MKTIHYIVQKEDCQSFPNRENVNEVELESKVNKFLIEIYFKNQKGAKTWKK